ncbi:hypothetical protein L1987_36534 [Smallanthus sonchifolius]|uniref:Uncharacterized protein n=1 Tax=Smallanthus sonchifolius TaxID=185202 RepID=A0ACB9HEI7_9ASTR|nr:hypothetical protein L1987_36534 [Smallanthus sonchifolius]
MLEEILGNASINAAVAHTDVEGKSLKTNAVRILNSHSHITGKLGNEMSFKCLSGKDGHTTALSLFHTVGNYYWDAKLALILVAFALDYGEFWLLAQIYSSNQLAKSVAILRQAPMIMDPSKPSFDDLNKLIQLVLKLLGCIIQLKELPRIYDSIEFPARGRALSVTPTAVYWNIRGIIACATQINSMGHEYGISSAEMQSWELSSLTLKNNRLLGYFKEQLEECYRVIGDVKEKGFIQIFNQLFETTHIDNMKTLKILTNSRDDPLPLFDGNTKRRVSLEVLRKRNVLLLISGLNMSYDEAAILEQIYMESRVQGSRNDALYEVVWVPIVDPNIEYTDAMEMQFEVMRKAMPWYSVYHPSNIDRWVKKCIGGRWHFRRDPIVVVLDPQGRELNPNAIHMMWVWGSTAFPFTTAREEALWRLETWRLELLVNGMDPTILNWIREDKYIFLYGGDDIEWIRKFTRIARAMAAAARIPLEMAYFGTSIGVSKKRENVRRVIATINMENLSYNWQDNTLIWYFWTRLENMLYSKIQLERADDQDTVMLQIKRLVSYDDNGSWALLCRGSQILTTGHGSTMLQTLADFDQWKEYIPNRGFDLSFKEYHDKLHVAANNHCRFEFPNEAGRIPQGIHCPECHRLMLKYMAFHCFHDHFQP